MKKLFKGFIRFILSIIFIIILIAVLLFIFRNPIAEYVIEKSGSAAAKAKVEVDGVNIKPFKLHIAWDRLQVTDKRDTWKNLFETSETEFSMAFKPLLDRKVIIEKMKISEVRFNTKRETDGKLPVKSDKPAKPSKLMIALKKNLQKEKENIPIFKAKNLKTKINVDSLMAILDFETPAKADSIKNIAEDRYEYWDNLIKNNDYVQRAEKIEKDVKKIDVNNMKTLADFQQNLNLAKNSYDNSRALYNEFTTQKKQIESDLKLMKNLKNDIPAWINNDYHKALNMAKLQDINVENVALMLFGDRVTDGILMIMQAIEDSREIAKTQPVKKERKEKMPHLPDFWIKDIDLSVITPDDLALSGRVLDISSNQKKTGLPLKINLKGEQENKGKINLAAIFDYREEDGKETINLDIIDVPVTNVKLSNFDLLPKKLKKGTASINSNLNLRDNLILAKIDMATQDIQFDYSSQSDLDKNLVRISRNITEAIDEVTLGVKVEQRDNDFSFKLNSNLDNLIASQMKKVVSDEINRAKLEVQKRVNKEMNKYKQQAQEIIDQKIALLQQEISKVNGKVNEQLSFVENKKQEVEDKVEAEKNKLQNQAEDKAEEALDDLLDKFKF